MNTTISLIDDYNKAFKALTPDKQKLLFEAEYDEALNINSIIDKIRSLTNNRIAEIIISGNTNSLFEDNGDIQKIPEKTQKSKQSILTKYFLKATKILKDCFKKKSKQIDSKFARKTTNNNKNTKPPIETCAIKQKTQEVRNDIKSKNNPLSSEETLEIINRKIKQKRNAIKANPFLMSNSSKINKYEKEMQDEIVELELEKQKILNKLGLDSTILKGETKIQEDYNLENNEDIDDNGDSDNSNVSQEKSEPESGSTNNDSLELEKSQDDTPDDLFSSFRSNSDELQKNLNLVTNLSKGESLEEKLSTEDIDYDNETNEEIGESENIKEKTTEEKREEIIRIYEINKINEAKENIIGEKLDNIKKNILSDNIFVVKVLCQELGIFKDSPLYKETIQELLSDDEKKVFFEKIISFGTEFNFSIRLLEYYVDFLTGKNTINNVVNSYEDALKCLYFIIGDKDFLVNYAYAYKIAAKYGSLYTLEPSFKNLILTGNITEFKKCFKITFDKLGELEKAS